MSGKQNLMTTVFASLVVGLLLTNPQTIASDRAAGWTSFRNGGTSTVQGALPVEWSVKDGITWQHETDGYGQSAPIVINDFVVVTSVIGEMKETCAVTAYQIQTGAKIWQVKVPAIQQGPSNYMNSRAAPTPVADENGVYAFFETGNLIAVDHNGSILWKRDFAKEFGPFKSNHGLGSSLAQTEELVLLNLEHKGPSFLMAVDKRSGRIRWKVERPSGSSWTSPIVVNADSQQQVVVSSAGGLHGYSSADGQELWKLDGLEGNSVPSPVSIGEFVFTGARIPEFGSAADAAKSNLCVRITGDEAEPYEVCWRSTKAVCDYASPVVDGEQIYFLNKVGVLHCADAMTGETIYQQRLRAECWATPIVTKNGIYFFAKDGTVKVVQRGREFAVLASNRLCDSENPPAPETYREGKSSHGHGSHGGSSGSHGGGRAGGMIAAMMKGDANGDGILQAEEISPDFRPMLKRIDTDGNGSLNQKELAAMAKNFAERRKNSQASSRDPIVYGVAAVPGVIVVRTGTRLYCIAGSESQADSRPTKEAAP